MSNESNSPEHVINGSEFRRNFAKYVRKVAESGEELVITKFGRPFVKLVPYRTLQSLHGMFENDCEIPGDIIEPFDGEWDAMKHDSEEDYY